MRALLFSIRFFLVFAATSKPTTTNISLSSSNPIFPSSPSNRSLVYSFTMKLLSTMFVLTSGVGVGLTEAAQYFRSDPRAVNAGDADATTYWWKFSGSDCGYDDVSPQPACGPKGKGDVDALKTCCTQTAGCGGCVRAQRHHMYTHTQPAHIPRPPPTKCKAQITPRQKHTLSTNKRQHAVCVL